ncbi:hypothetical protein H4R19_002600 [Coemansia spiralis]|nr:hypothetical protein H4R19_002600 [Coemansia spiralis]
MQLYDLPNDVLALILGRLLEEADTSGDAKASFNLAAINQRLRQVVLPLVYREVFVQLPATRHFRSRPDTTRARNRPTEEAAAKTNAGLAASAHCAGLVRRVLITFIRFSEGADEVGAAVAALREASTLWPAVQTLEVAGARGDYQVSKSDTLSMPTRVPAVHQLLVAMLPNVQQLFIGGQVELDPVRTLFHSVTESYQGRLKTVQVTYTPSPNHQRLHMIQHQNAASPPRPDLLLPRIDASGLVRLHLENAHPEHSWASFGADSSSRSIEFPALQHLRLGYERYSDLDKPTAIKRRPQLHFPRLDTLQLDCDTDSCPFLDNAVFLRGVERVQLGGPPELFTAVLPIVLPVAKTLALRICGSDDNQAASLPPINDLLAGANQCEITRLHLRWVCPPAAIKGALAMWLTDLSLSQTISIDDMFELVGRLPRLARIMVNCSDCQAPRTDISLPKPGGRGHPIQPLSKSVKRLALQDVGAGRWNARRSNLLKYILLKLPSLAVLAANGAEHFRVERFYTQHRPWYPHLATVKLVSELNRYLEA